ncbi:MAG: hypothetical protein AVDCRST_MAG29-1686 [uncultured Nocardioidaceae bacterium]|uniref:Uncharacterized protein n=1 Tax=uncultured Nocardioidaceae bacterium TaxID=253824 RepID=A0A6J4LV13_9ACTN|nr:MAG: hypothetical protein AVDCRST_MAG29-1686 [uncultured Nocardioidaceae bacterium]
MRRSWQGLLHPARVVPAAFFAAIVLGTILHIEASVHRRLQAVRPGLHLRPSRDPRRTARPAHHRRDDGQGGALLQPPLTPTGSITVIATTRPVGLDVHGRVCTGRDAYPPAGRLARRTTAS